MCTHLRSHDWACDNLRRFSIGLQSCGYNFNDETGGHNFEEQTGAHPTEECGCKLHVCLLLVFVQHSQLVCQVLSVSQVASRR